MAALGELSCTYCMMIKYDRLSDMFIFCARLLRCSSQSVSWYQTTDHDGYYYKEQYMGFHGMHGECFHAVTDIIAHRVSSRARLLVTCSPVD
jgi:hypothetical protein